MNNLVYKLNEKVYTNWTNGCTSDCVFCLRKSNSTVAGHDLWLGSENITADDVISQLENFLPANEVAFCGYGEPTLKLGVMKDVATYIKQNSPNTHVRLNTNGHANFLHGTNILPEIAGLVDEISVSLNAPTARQYYKLTRPIIQARDAHRVVLDFIRAASQSGIKTVASVVDRYVDPESKLHRLDLDACEKLAKDHGATLRVREWLQKGY